MPRRADLTGPMNGDDERLPPVGLRLLLAALAAAALLQIPALLGWWSEDRDLLRQILGNAGDPIGLQWIPTLILFSIPTLAAAALMTFVVSSCLGSFARPQFAFHVLVACAALQAGLVVGELLTLQRVHALGEQLLSLLAAENEPVTSARVAEWFARHDAAGRAVSWRLVWICGGYLLAAAVSVYRSSDAPILRASGR